MPPKKSPCLAEIPKNKAGIQRKNKQKFAHNSKKITKVAAKKRQSPIDIRKEILCYDSKLCQKDSLRIVYKPGDCCGVTVSSSGFRVDVKEKCSTTLCAKHLPGTYQLIQFHAHWSEDGQSGSEHMFDGKPMSGEVHFVFWNKKYKSFKKAVEKNDGLAVLGVFLKEGTHSAAYEILFNSISQASISKKSIPLLEKFSFEDLLPESREFVTYLGSLTTPPFSENVIWTLFIDPIPVSKEQLDILRAITPTNYRKCQNLCKRKVFSSTIPL